MARIFGERILQIQGSIGRVFFRAILDEASFRRADLRGADLANASCKKADLFGANLGLDELGGPTSVEGTNFTDACLERTDFTGAIYNDRTIFPVGFDPLQRGLRKR